MQKNFSRDLFCGVVCQKETGARKRELQLKTGFGRGYLKRRIENYLEE